MLAAEPQALATTLVQAARNVAQGPPECQAQTGLTSPMQAADRQVNTTHTTVQMLQVQEDEHEG
jgi:hypothetical protein